MVAASNGTEDGRESSEHSDCSMLTEVGQGGAPLTQLAFRPSTPLLTLMGPRLLAVVSSLTIMNTNEVARSIVTIRSKVLDREAIKASTDGRVWRPAVWSHPLVEEFSREPVVSE